MKINELPPEEVYLKLNSSKTGLTDKEVKNRYEIYGLNQIEEVKKKSIILKFLANLYQLLALLLWAASILAFLSGTPQLGFAIIAVIIINAIFSFWQEYKAEKALEALKKILPSRAKVIRNGLETEILSAELVPGDVLVLEEGDNISADSRLVEANQMKIDSSTLTGESRPVRKVSSQAKKSEEDNLIGTPNIIFAGTSVAAGSGKALVFATGKDTEFNQIASLTQEISQDVSPLKEELSRITRIIAFIAVLLGIILFTVNLWVVQLPLQIAFIFAIGLTVANVPEGLLPTVTLALAASVQKMARKNALIKRLSSVETLGSTNIICTDKTGTLTRNEMTVRKVWLPWEIIDVTGAGYSPEGKFLHRGNPIDHHEIRELNLLMRSATFCNDSKLVEPGTMGGKWNILGDPTEAALLVAARKSGFIWEEQVALKPRIMELPFDSQRKSMISIHHDTGKQVAYVKGAPKKIINLSNTISVDGTVVSLSSEEKNKIIAKHDDLAASGLRILAMAYRDLPEDYDNYSAQAVDT